MFIGRKQKQKLEQQFQNIERAVKEVKEKYKELQMFDSTGIKHSEKEEISRLKDQLELVTNMLSDVISTTFEGRDSFETVVFQVKHKPPIIYHNGKCFSSDRATSAKIFFDIRKPTAIEIRED